MHAVWHFILYVLACWSHDPASLAAERARCAGAVNVAYAALAVEPPPPPAPRRDKVGSDTSKVGSKVGSDFPAKPDEKCDDCRDTGRIYRSDGGYVRCPCKPCPTGRCPTAR
jgi:hypothetical protein